MSTKSAGVTSREIVVANSSAVSPSGTPAGIIGTSQSGPAFVPLTFSNYQNFTLMFGSSAEGDVAPIAMQNWLSNSTAGTFVRVLGAGDGLQRDSGTGTVKNGGFVVGSRLPNSSGILANNPYANSGDGSVEGRTYFLGCLMSESNGSDYLSSAGIQTDASAVPVLRGILLAPSGVILHLSGNSSANSSAPSTSATARNTERGGVTGSVSLSAGGQEFVMLLCGYNPPSGKSNVISASFDMTSSRYFGSVFNTDPLKIQEEGHLLYASYDIYPTLAVVTGSGVVSGSTSISEDVALLLSSSVERISAQESALSSTVPVYESFENRFSSPRSPFVISQEFGGLSYDLFRFKMISDGEPGKFIKISIENIVKLNGSKFGTFDVVVRDLYDSDDQKVVLESFRSLSLDKESDRYISKVIGDARAFYDFDTSVSNQKIVIEGTYANRSNYVYVEVSDALNKKEIPEEAIPFGFRGPGHLVTSGSLLASTEALSSVYKRIREIPFPYRLSVSQGSGITKRADPQLYWGFKTNRWESLTLHNKTTPFDESIESLIKYFPDNRADTIDMWVDNNPGAANVGGSVLDCDLFNKNKFTLSSISVRTGSNGYADPDQWLSASYTRGVVTTSEDNKTRALSPDDLLVAGNRKYVKFTLPVQGGFDGVNIFDREKSKLTNLAAKREMDDTAQGVLSGPTVSSYRKAIDVFSTEGDIQILAIPGIRHSSITDYAQDSVENRFDSIYVMDIEERNDLNQVITGSDTPNVTYTVSAFKDRSLDTSFSCAYFPDVSMTNSETGATVTVPPSVSLLGVLSFNDKISHPWFAPAGFTRGSLVGQNPVIRLNRQNLDDLYDAGINPIVSQPGRGLVVWGQKTLQNQESSLDRINVRRLLIYIRRQIRNIANSFLFEPNRTETLERFQQAVSPVLKTIQDRQGIDKYKIVVDSSTTTQIDVENNTIRGKIYLIPVGSVETISLDFVASNSTF